MKGGGRLSLTDKTLGNEVVNAEVLRSIEFGTKADQVT